MQEVSKLKIGREFSIQVPKQTKWNLYIFMHNKKSTISIYLVKVANSIDFFPRKKVKATISCRSMKSVGE